MSTHSTASELFVELGTTNVQRISKYLTSTDLYQVYQFGAADFALVPGEAYLVHRLVLHGMLSEQSIEVLHQRFARLAEDFEARVREDRNLNLAQRHGTSAVLAIRPWSLSIFERLRRAD